MTDPTPLRSEGYSGNRIETPSGQPALCAGHGQVQNGVTTIYVGALYEKNVTTGVTTTYYFAESQRLALRQGGTVYFLLGDHLGITSLTLDANGNKIGEMKYYPFGETADISCNAVL